MTDLLERIGELGRLDAGHVGFGAERHEYRLGPCLTPRRLSAIAAIYGVRLPEDYERFLLSCGNGGAGPGYGLQRFDAVESTNSIPKAHRKGAMRTIARSSRMKIEAPILYDSDGQELDPFTVALWDAVRRHAPDGDEGPQCLTRPFPFAKPAFGTACLDAGGSDRFHDGSWMLSDYGCGMEARLVLNGPFSGQVWVATLEDDMAPFREFANLHSELDLPEPAPGPFTFSLWYEHWLAARLSELQTCAE